MTDPTVIKPEGNAGQPDAQDNTANPERQGSNPAVVGPEPHEAADAEEIRQQRERHRRRRKWRLRWRKAGIISEFILALALTAATVFNAYFVRSQWQAMTDTLKATNALVEKAQVQANAAKASADAMVKGNDLTERTMKLTHRARLYFGDIPPAPAFLTKKGATWQIRYTNGGRGPATNIREKSTVLINTIAPRQLAWSDPNRQPEPSFKPALRPDQADKASISFVFLTGAAAMQNISDYMAGKKALTVQLLLEYADEFGDSHVTSICVTYTRNGRAYSFTLCPDGNYEK